MLKDYLVRGISANKMIRVLGCVTTDVCNNAVINHQTYPTASAALGRVMTATVLMGSLLKGNERVAIHINGGGIIGDIFSEANATGNVKAYVRNPSAHVDLNSQNKLNVGKIVGTDGYLKVTKYLGMKQPFTSQVQLQTGEIGDDFSYYFYISEQIPSIVSLGVLVDVDNKVKASGGVIIQLMPGASPDDFTTVENSIAAVTNLSYQIAEGEKIENIISTVLPDVEFLAKYPISGICNCNREKIVAIISSLGKEEVIDMLNTDGGCCVKCDYCSQNYIFDRDDLLKIIDKL